MKKRTLVLLSVVALMVVMLAMSVAPAFAAPTWHCVDPTGTQTMTVFTTSDKRLLEAQGWECTNIHKRVKPL
jgi:hypothetical protein